MSADPQRAMVQIGAPTVEEINLALTLICKWINELGTTQVTTAELDTALPQDLDVSDAPTFNNVTLTALSPLRLVATSPAGTLASVRDLMEWAYGTAKQILLDNSAGDGTIIIKTPQDIDVDSSPQFATVKIYSADGFTLLHGFGDVVTV